MHQDRSNRTRYWRIAPRPEPVSRPNRRQTLAELVLIVGVTFAYFLTRGLIRRREEDAVRYANDILKIERFVHLTPEHALQTLAMRHDWLLTFANTFYLSAHLPVLIAVAVWLFIARPWAYPWFRNAFLLSALFGLSIYVLLPVAPPRFMPGFVDTMALYGFNVDGSKAGPLYNPYAAMPSLHVGWSLLAGIAMMVCARTWWLKAAGIALPVLMALSVIMTGNHYILDALAGMAVVLVALMLSAFWSSWHMTRTATARTSTWEPSPHGRR